MRSSLPTLGQWFARPLSPIEAGQLLARAQSRQKRLLLRGRTCLSCRLAILIARFWLGEPVEDDWAFLKALSGHRSRRARVLVELVYGQLLMSRRLHGAMNHLDDAFAEARHLFSPGDYFNVLKRHALLRKLPLSAAPLPPEDLPDLLSVAAVMARLAGNPAHRGTINRKDTVG